MKNLICLCLALVLSLSCVANAQDMQSADAVFTISSIRHDRSPDQPLVFSVTLPKTYEDGILFVNMYTNGAFTKTILLDASSGTSFRNLQVPLTYKDGDGHILTPDRIKLFVWNKNNLKPLCIQQDVLTDTVIENANSTTVDNILVYLLGKNGKPNAITRLRTAVIGKEYAPGETPPREKYLDILNLLDSMETCANIAYNNRSSVLLTCESTKRLLDEEFDTLEGYVDIIKNKKEQKDELLRIYETLTSNQKDALDKLLRFFDIPNPIK